MENPNFGITNFDNILYGLLTIFQSVTLEGWSSNLVFVEQAYGVPSFFFFIPLVFIGAFFLLNLTLAVINSKFTEAHKKETEKNRQEKLLLLKNKGKKKKWDGRSIASTDDYSKSHEIISLRQFVLAKKAAANMIAFLR